MGGAGGARAGPAQLRLASGRRRKSMSDPVGSRARSGLGPRPGLFAAHVHPDYGRVRVTASLWSRALPRVTDRVTTPLVSRVLAGHGC